MSLTQTPEITFLRYNSVLLSLYLGKRTSYKGTDPEFKIRFGYKLKLFLARHDFHS